MDRWKILERQIAYEHPWMRIVTDTLERDGTTKPYFYLDFPISAVATIAVTGNRQLVLTRQYRHPVGLIITDLPAGRTFPGEDPAEAARRELKEETGYSAGRFERLGEYNPFPGSMRVTEYMYFATELVAGSQNLDDDEELEVFLRPFDEVYAEVLAGDHLDGALQFGCLLARARGLV